MLTWSCRPAHCAAVTGSVEMLQALRSERGNLWLASHVTGNYPLHEAAIAQHIGTHHIFLLSKSFNYQFFFVSEQCIDWLRTLPTCKITKLLLQRWMARSYSFCCFLLWIISIIAVLHFTNCKTAQSKLAALYRKMLRVCFGTPSAGGKCTDRVLSTSDIQS